MPLSLYNPNMTEWFLYFLERQANPNPKRRFRNYDHFLEWMAEAYSD